MTKRASWQGMLTIARFNWPYYLAAVVLLGLCLLTGWLTAIPLIRLFCLFISLGALWFLIGSLGVSHLVYDRSDLYRLNWLARVLPQERGRYIFCHCGFDEVSLALRANIGGNWLLLDHYDPSRMTEASIHRARRLFPPHDSEPASFNHWPVDSASSNAIFALLGIHELRSSEERAAWFAEAKRCLLPGGRIVVAEHLRNTANFLAFGPGFLHFHSRSNWQHAWEQAGLRSFDEFAITPWIRVFVLGQP